MIQPTLTRQLIDAHSDRLDQQLEDMIREKQDILDTHSRDLQEAIQRLNDKLDDSETCLILRYLDH